MPAPGTEGHPRSFSFERPVPHPEAFGSARGLRGAGCPITLTWERAGVTDVEAELREKGIQIAFPKGLSPLRVLRLMPDLPDWAAKHRNVGSPPEGKENR